MKKFTFRGKELVLGKKTAVCGILNVTPDSFSDGGSFLNREAAAAHAVKMEEEGADMIDVGAESTRPGAEPVPAREEMKRLLPVIRILKRKLQIPVSADTFKPETAEAALREGADIINDVTGLREANGMAEIISSHGAGVIIMHMQGSPARMQVNPSYSDVVSDVESFLLRQSEKASAAGIPHSSIAVDPGIGFGKNTVHNLRLINELDRLSGTKYPVLIGVSRKSVIGDILKLPVSERLEGTAALVACSILRGADIIRVHDVKSMVRAARMADAVKTHGRAAG